MKYYLEYDIRISPFQANLIHEVMCQDFPAHFGFGLGNIFVVFEKGKGRGYFVKEEFLNSGQKIVELILEKKLSLDFLKENFDRESEKMFFSGKPDLLSNIELIEEIKKFKSSFQRSYVYGVLPFLAPFALEFEIKDLLLKINKEKLFSALVVPAGTSWDSVERYELSKVKTQKELEEHAQKWVWISYDYESGARPLSEFQIEWTDTKGQKLPDPDIKMKELVAESERTIKKLKLDDKATTLVRAARDFIYFKEYRKGQQSKAFYMFETVLTEVGKRLGLSLTETRFLTTEELVSTLLSGFDKEAVAQRQDFSIYVQTTTKYKIYSGRDAKSYLGQVKYEEEKNASGDVIIGTASSPGFAKGTVKIIKSKSDIGKMTKGDILVSPMTTPELVSAMKLAGAVVTDTGGITCHAAIVSRELGIPCVIGTKNSTKILKNGDMVEVDADNGIVRKI